MVDMSRMKQDWIRITHLANEIAEGLAIEPTLVTEKEINACRVEILNILTKNGPPDGDDIPSEMSCKEGERI